MYQNHIGARNSNSTK